MLKKVKSEVYTNETYESQWGTFFVHKIEFEDGSGGEYNSKSDSQNKFIQGQEAHFEEKIHDYNGTKKTRIKPINPDFNNQSKPSAPGRSSGSSDHVQKSIIKQNSLTNACNIVGEADIEKSLDIAEIFSDWVIDGKKGTITQRSSNDMPF